MPENYQYFIGKYPVIPIPVPYLNLQKKGHDFRSDYLGEYEAICETTLARESGP
jgi:hypothetical protein